MTLEFIDPGRFRTALALEAPAPVPDGAGGLVDQWTEVATVVALVEPVRANAAFGAGQSLETVSHRITLRFRSGVASGMRFVKGGRVFDIVTVHDPDETGRYLVCRAQEKGL